VTQPIPISDLQPGDLVFIWGPGEGGGPPGHVGLYIGGGQMVHAPNSGSYVKVDSIYWWSGARLAAGRVR
jgi:cell wall-associated NlpC family hydrolase